VRNRREVKCRRLILSARYSAKARRNFSGGTVVAAIFARRPRTFVILLNATAGNRRGHYQHGSLQAHWNAAAKIQADKQRTEAVSLRSKEYLQTRKIEFIEAETEKKLCKLLLIGSPKKLDEFFDLSDYPEDSRSIPLVDFFNTKIAELMD